MQLNKSSLLNYEKEYIAWTKQNQKKKEMPQDNRVFYALYNTENWEKSYKSYKKKNSATVQYTIRRKFFNKRKLRKPIWNNLRVSFYTEYLAITELTIERDWSGVAIFDGYVIFYINDLVSGLLAHLLQIWIGPMVKKSRKPKTRGKKCKHPE